MRGFFSVVLSILGGFSDVLVLDILLKPGNPGLRYELYCVCFGTRAEHTCSMKHS